MADRKLAWRMFWPLALALAAGALLVHSFGQRTGSSARVAASLDDWDIPRLAEYLNGKGLGLRVVSSMNGRHSDWTAYLTTTDKGWEELSRPRRDRSDIERWRGTMYCEQAFAPPAWAYLIPEWGDCCLVAGPFLLFGDRELLGQVRAALADLSQAED
jgi:hypothetical protein